MALRKYKVQYVNPQGNVVQSIFVGTPETISEELKQKGAVTLKIERYFEISFRRKSDLVLAMLRNLVSLIESGFSLNRAFETLLSAEKDVAFKKVLSDTLEALEAGGSVFDALSLHPEHFPLPLRMIIKSGEESGKMLQALKDAHEFLQRELELTKDVSKKLTGPLVILAVGIIALFFNTIYTIPRITQSSFFKTIMSKQAGFAFKLISITTKAVPIVVILFFVLSILTLFFYRTYQDQTERLLLKIPVLKVIWFNREVFLVYFTLSRLIKAGIRFDTAADVVKSTAKLKSVRDSFDRVITSVHRGVEFYDELPLLDQVERAILSSATNTKRLAEVFELISRRKYEAYQETVKKLPAICQAFTYGVLMYLFFLLFLGVIVPYYKSISVMMQKI